MLKFLSNLPKFTVSRHKTLLKRRKINTKKRTVSKKQLAEEVKHFKYSHEYKAYQVQKELDRRKHPSHHLNELMDDIFYPDITRTNPTAAEIAAESIQERKLTFQEYEDKLEEVLEEQLLPSNILENIFAEFEHQFQPKHYELVLKKLGQYLRNREKVKANLENSWKRMNQTLRSKDPKYQARKCPYLFLQAHDLHRYEPWKAFIGSLTQKISASSSPRQFGHYVRTILKINSMLDGVPEEMMKGFLCILNQGKFLEQLSKEEQVNCIHLFSLRKKVLYPQFTAIAHNETHAPDKMSVKSCLWLCSKVLADPSCSSYDLAQIFRPFRFHQLKFKSTFEQSFKKKIIQHLSDTPVEKVIDYLSLYLEVPIKLMECKKEGVGDDGKKKEDTMGHEEFLELLKFDIIRKIPLAKSKNHLLKCLNFVERGAINYGAQPNILIYPTQINGLDLFGQCLHSILYRYSGTNALTSPEIITLAEACFRNNFRDSNTQQLLLAELLRNKESLTLNELTHSIFKTKMLGYESVTTANILLGELQKRYQIEMRHLKQNKKLYLVDHNKGLEASGSQGASGEEVELQETLILGIWVAVDTISRAQQQGHEKPVLNVDRMLKVYPLETDSPSPFIRALSAQIYQIVKPLSSFWPIKIKHKQALISGADTRYQSYYLFASQNPVFRVLEKEAKESQSFSQGRHRKHKLYLPAPWLSHRAFSTPHYLQWLKQDHKILYFNPEKTASEELLAQRQKIQ